MYYVIDRHTKKKIYSCDVLDILRHLREEHLYGLNVIESVKGLLLADNTPGQKFINPGEIVGIE